MHSIYSYRLENIMRSIEGITRKTKIVCTIGPSCWSQENLGELLDAGMNIARLNFSHGDHNSHGETLSRLRGALASRPHKNVCCQVYVLYTDLYFFLILHCLLRLL